jgi:hypothetical protein
MAPLNRIWETLRYGYLPPSADYRCLGWWQFIRDIWPSNRICGLDNFSQEQPHAK